MITIDELKAKLGGMKTSVDDLRDALSIEASEKRLAELEHQMTMPGFYDDQARSQKIISEMGEVKNKLERFGKLATQYEEAETLLEMIEEENDPALAAEGEEAVEAVEKAIDELQLMTMLNGEYDHSNAILTFHAGTGGTEAQDWAEMLMRMYTRWAEAHGYSVEVLDVLDGDEAGIKSASMMVKGANAYGMLKSEHGVHRLVRVSPFDSQARRQTSFSSLEVMPELDNNINIEIKPRRYRDAGLPFLRCGRPAHQQDFFGGPPDPQAHRHRDQLPDPAQPAAKPRVRDGNDESQAVPDRIAATQGQDRRYQGRAERDRLGPPDPQLRLYALHDG